MQTSTAMVDQKKGDSSKAIAPHHILEISHNSGVTGPTACSRPAFCQMSTIYDLLSPSAPPIDTQAIQVVPATLWPDMTVTSLFGNPASYFGPGPISSIGG